MEEVSSKQEPSLQARSNNGDSMTLRMKMMMTTTTTMAGSTMTTMTTMTTVVTMTTMTSSSMMPSIG
jgi:hypothetical protein